MALRESFKDTFNFSVPDTPRQRSQKARLSLQTRVSVEKALCALSRIHQTLGHPTSFWGANQPELAFLNSEPPSKLEVSNQPGIHSPVFSCAGPGCQHGIRSKVATCALELP